MAGKLSVVATPIGNLGDFSFRAVEALKEANKIVAEDTRTSKKLLNHYEINTPLESYHLHNEHSKVVRLIEQITEGQHIALISDAGTPAISDPGYLLVREALENDILVDVIPGATAFIPALIKSGFALHRFTFEGFLPSKKGRQTKILEWADSDITIVFYESPHKILKTLVALREVATENRRISISREITKLYEETVTGTLTSVISHFENHSPKGEFVVVLEGKHYSEEYAKRKMESE